MGLPKGLADWKTVLKSFFFVTGRDLINRIACKSQTELYAGRIAHILCMAAIHVNLTPVTTCNHPLIQ